MEHILAMCHTRTAVSPLLDETLKKHTIIEMEECTIKRLDDVRRNLLLGRIQGYSTRPPRESDWGTKENDERPAEKRHQANQIGEPTNIMRDSLKRQQRKARTHLASLTCDFTALIKSKLERRALLCAQRRRTSGQAPTTSARRWVRTEIERQQQRPVATS